MYSLLPLSLTVVFALSAADTRVLFDPSSPDIGPFPTNVLTKADPKQLTGRRVDLPFPAECTPGSLLSACSDVELLNHLDGFSLYPQLRVCFSGPVNPATISDGLIVVPLKLFSPWIRTNRIVYDTAANCAYAKPDRVLEAGQNYALIVTTAIRDTAGRPVKADSKFTNALLGGLTNLPVQLAGLEGLLPQLSGVVASASVFTTLSATDWIKKARSYVSADPVSGRLAAFQVADMKQLSSIKWLTQTTVAGVTPDKLTPNEVPLARLDGVGRLAVGTFLSPNFLSSTLTIPQVDTKSASLETQPYVLPIPNVPSHYALISFHVCLPSGDAPAGGYPVVIYGHGMGDDQWMGATTYIASTLAKNNIALIGVEVFGHGYGPASLIRLTGSTNRPVEVPSPGRTMPIDGAFNPAKGGCILLPGPFATRDCFRQTAVDMFTLIKLIAGPKGLGSQLNLNVNRISYVGQSFGAVLGTMVVATEPRVKTAVLNGGGGPVVDIARMQNPPALGYGYLQSSKPPILSLDVLAFRGQTTVPTTTDAAALKAFEVTEWLNMPGDPISFAAGLANKPVLFQISRGDE